MGYLTFVSYFLYFEMFPCQGWVKQPVICSRFLQAFFSGRNLFTQKEKVREKKNSTIEMVDLNTCRARDEADASPYTDSHCPRVGQCRRQNLKAHLLYQGQQSQRTKRAREINSPLASS